MNLLGILVHSLLSFITLYFGIAKGLALPAIFIVSIASAIHLQKEMKRLMKSYSGDVADYKTIASKIDYPLYRRYFAFFILPHAIILFSVIFPSEQTFIWVEKAVLANHQYIDVLQLVIQPKSEALALIVGLKGELYLNAIYLVSFISISALILSLICHSIIARMWISAYIGRVWSDPKKNSKNEDLKGLILVPIIVLVWPLVVPYELGTDHYIGFKDGVTYLRQQFMFLASMIQLFYPIFFLEYDRFNI